MGIRAKLCLVVIALSICANAHAQIVTASPYSSRPRFFVTDPAACARGSWGFNLTSSLWKGCNPANTWAAFTVGGYAPGGTDVAVADGGTGRSTATAFAPIFGGTTSTGAFQSGTAGTAGQVLTSNGAGVLPTFQAGGGAPFADTTSIVEGSADATKELRFEVDGFTTGTVRVATPPDANFTMARTDAAQTFTGVQTFSSAPTSPGVGAGTERFGSGATLHASATNDTAVGNSATISASGANNTIVGSGSSITGSSERSVVVGSGSSVASDTQGIVIGSNTIIPGGSSYRIVLGSDGGTMSALDTNTAFIGTNGFTIDKLQIGGSSNGYTRTNTIRQIRPSGALVSGGSSNQGGASISLQGGPSSGTGAGGTATIGTTFSAASGSTRNTYVDRFIVPARGVALTDAVAVSLFEIELPTLAMTGGSINATIRATDSGDTQSFTQLVLFSAVNDSGSVISSIAPVPMDLVSSVGSKSVSAGTLTTAWTIIDDGTKITIQLNANTSLTPSGTNAFVVYYTLTNNSEQAVTILP